jgi:UDP-2-acetamido-3-amino-2,3-dideoxy-glucuronate N-acetyltransferase
MIMTSLAPVRSVAVIGAGYWGSHIIRNVSALPSANLRMVCDRNPERLRQVAAQYQVETTTDLSEICDRSEIEAVFVATPAATHFDVARQCLIADKHVFVEKPLATTVNDARVLGETAERVNRVLMVGHLFQYEPATLKLIELAVSGAIGELRYARGVRTSMNGTVRLDADVIWDALIHDAYVQAELFGRAPDRVLVVGGAYLQPPLADVAFAMFDFGAGRIAHASVGWYALEKARSLIVVGSEGILAYDGLADAPLKRYDRRYVESDELDLEGRRHWRWVDAEGEVVPVDASEPLRDECEHFLDCIATDSRPRSDGLAGLRSVEIVDACARSAAAGGVWQAIQDTTALAPT